jgi:2-polyprenyl-3-methyl-5-hydroxy-6-metoxy-1,4-benzoquinol methylase
MLWDVCSFVACTKLPPTGRRGVELRATPEALTDLVQQAPDGPQAILSDSFLPLLALAGLLVGALGASNLLKSEAKISVLPDAGTKFDDVPDYVPGNIEAKKELQSVVAFLKNSAVFQKLGANVPKRVLLSGLGDKDLMAKAIAGESGVPFVQIVSNDSSFRDAFAEACDKAPCVVFVPLEGRSDDERYVALEAMSGFSNYEVVFVASSNRSDVSEETSRFVELEVGVEPEPDWSASVALATYVSQNGPRGRQSESDSAAPWRHVNVLELGSGTGLAGIAAASVGANVMLTDRSRFVPLMGKNINANQARIDVGSIDFEAFEWAQVEKPPVEVAKKSWDVVLGADLVRDAASVRDFADTLAFLLGPMGAAAGGTAIYAHRPLSTALDVGLQAALEECGLSLTVLPPLPPRASGESSPWCPSREGQEAAELDKVLFWELRGSSSAVTAEMAAQVLMGQRHTAAGADQVPAEFWKELSQKSKTAR